MRLTDDKFISLAPPVKSFCCKTDEKLILGYDDEFEWTPRSKSSSVAVQATEELCAYSGLHEFKPQKPES